jgi:hypothetical protein
MSIAVVERSPVIIICITAHFKDPLTPQASPAVQNKMPVHVPIPGTLERVRVGKKDICNEVY